MAVQRMTYLDLPTRTRVSSSQRAILKLQEHLNDPSTTAEQSEKIRGRIAHLQQWMSGTLPVNQPEGS